MKQVNKKCAYWLFIHAYMDLNSKLLIIVQFLSQTKFDPSQNT